MSRSRHSSGTDAPTQVLARLLASGVPTSVAQLAAASGIATEAVDETLDELRALGFPLKGGSPATIQIEYPVDLLELARIERALSDDHSRLADCELFLSVGSTNDYLLTQGHREAGARVCLAEVQTAGRGRRGRGWSSPFGANVYLSMSRRHASMAGLSGLSIALGVATAEALHRHGAVEVGIKWPNDLLWMGRKVGGLLVDVSGDPQRGWLTVAGVGLNVNMPIREGANIDQPWSDLEHIVGRTIDRNVLAADVIRAWLGAFDTYATHGLGAFTDRYAALDLCAGQPVSLRLAEQVIAGTARGINADGALVLERDGKTETHYAADVSLRL